MKGINMRKAFNNVRVFDTTSEQGNNFKGISLGFDHCAEHEWGTEGIRRDLGVAQNYTFEDFIKDYDVANKEAPTSIEDFKISQQSQVLLLTVQIKATELKNKYSSFKEIEEEYKSKYKEQTGKKNVPTVVTEVAVLLNNSWAIRYKADQIAENYPVLSEKLKKEGPQHIELTAEEFLVLNEFFRADTGDIRAQAFVHAAQALGFSLKMPSYWREYTESHWSSDAFLFITSGKNNCQILKDVYTAIIQGTAYYGISSAENPFSRSSPCIVVSPIPEAEQQAIALQWSELRKLSKEILDTGIHAKLKNANKWYYALSPSKNNDGELKFWLNPQEQNKYNYGWFTLEHLNQWAENTGPIVKE